MDKIRIRDFIYLDIERLKSIISQIESGVIEKYNGTEGTEKSTSGNIEAGILGFIKGTGEAEVAIQKAVTETKSLHDYIYNKVEFALMERKLVYEFPNKSIKKYSDEIRNLLGPSSFILIKGKVKINDFGHINEIFANYIQITKFLVECSVIDEDLNNKERTAKIRELTNIRLGNLNENFFSEIRDFIKLFYKDRIIIKILPFKSNPEFRFVGNINPEFLKDDINSITYKYGTAPVSEWTIFGQIASIPPENRSQEKDIMNGSAIEIALQNIFDQLREIEFLAQSVAYPEIAITPIAIYRE